jgi:hypothetical protein
MSESGSASRRAAIQDQPDGLHVTIPREFSPLGTLLLAMGFALFYWNGSWVITDIRGADRSYPDFIFLVIWLAVLTMIARAILWSMFGRERIIVDGEYLKIRREILHVGITHSFELAKVQALRVFVSIGFRIPILNPEGKKTLGVYLMSPDHRGSIIFEYKSKVRAFGIDLPEDEARRIIQRMEQHCATLRLQ